MKMQAAPRVALVCFSCLLGNTAARSAVIYSFQGTSSDGRVQSFQFTSAAFIRATSGVAVERLDSCTGCAVSAGPIFAPSNINGFLGDQLTFSDSNGTGYSYMFPLGAFGGVGRYSSLLLPSRGTLTVRVTDALAVGNAAGFLFCGNTGLLCPSADVAPGAIATILGTESITDAPMEAMAPIFPTTMGGVAVTVVDAHQVERHAQIVSVSPTHVNFVVAPESATGPAQISVSTSNGRTSVPARITRVAPGLFTENRNGEGVLAGQVLRVRQDGSHHGEPVAEWDSNTLRWVAKPIALESDVVYLELYGTGIRNANEVQIRCWCNKEYRTLPVVYFGPQGSVAGLDQVNARLPAILTGSGPIYLWLAVDNAESNMVTMRVQ